MTQTRRTGAVPITNDAHVYTARAAVRERAELLGFGRIERDELVIVASELASNILKYGIRGEITVTALNDPENGPGIRIEARDEGPAFHDIEMALRDGWGDRGPLDPAAMSKRKGLGAGLGAVIRFTDSFQCDQERTGKQITVVRYVQRPRARAKGASGQGRS
jgi:anti-sigma regulatory factor (Ser/Thr protein kinase)